MKVSTTMRVLAATAATAIIAAKARVASGHRIPTSQRHSAAAASRPLRRGRGSHAVQARAKVQPTIVRPRQPMSPAAVKMPRSRTAGSGETARAANPAAVVMILSRHGRSMKPTAATTFSRRPAMSGTVVACSRTCTASAKPTTRITAGITVVTRLSSLPAAP